jgi:hypothetical protein
MYAVRANYKSSSNFFVAVRRTSLYANCATVLDCYFQRPAVLPNRRSAGAGMFQERLVKKGALQR